MRAPSPPPAPDPYKTSAADQQGHTGTAIAQTWMNNPQEFTPFGTVRNERTGTQYTKDATGNQIEIPTFTRTTTLSAPEQQKYDLENQLAFQAGGIANKQLGRLDETLSKPMGGDYSQYSDKALSAMRSRMQPELDRQQEMRMGALFNQGVRPGSEAYREAVSLGDKQRNDAELAMILGSGDEASRALQMDMALRNQPINEIAGLMGQSQVNVPQFAQFNPGRIAPTSVADNVYRSAAIDQQNYQSRLQSRNAMMGGLFSLGGAAMRLPFMMG